MGFRFIEFAAIALTATMAFGCGGDEGDRGGPDEDSAGGKADDEDEQQRACKLDPGDGRELIQFVNDKHVQFRCRATETTERANAKSFVETDCCDPQIREFELATGCPQQAKFEVLPDPLAPSGERQRCVSDEAGTETNGLENLVATSCCELLCGSPQWLSNDESTGRCQDSDSGRFIATACCLNREAETCGNAQWEVREQDRGVARCWAQDGEFANQYATNSCCLDQCFLANAEEGVVSQSGAFPLECMHPSEDECSGAHVNAAGACELGSLDDLTDDEKLQVSEEHGTYGKAMCCAGMEGLSIERADDCHTADLFDDDEGLMGCA